MSSKALKTGAPIRRGFRYQDYTALKLTLELYLARTPFDMYLENKEAGSLDDITIVFDDHIDAYQVKYATDPNTIYTVDDFTDPKSNIFIKKFSDSWLSLKNLYPSKTIDITILTNRQFSDEIISLLDDKSLAEEFIQGKQRKRPREIRQSLLQATQLDEDTFKQFISSLRFEYNQPNLDQLEAHILEYLLDHQLGITNRSTFHDLMNVIVDHAERIREPLTYRFFVEFFDDIDNRYLLAQNFSVDNTTLIKLDVLTEKLDRVLEKADGQYVIVTGLPGMGKSTSLTNYFDERQQIKKEIIVRYYCFVDINDPYQKKRLEATSLRVNLLHRLTNEFWDICNRRHSRNEDSLYGALETIGQSLIKKGSKLVIFLDGLDHAERMEEELQQSLIQSLPESLPKGVVIVVGTQQLHKWPRSLKQSRDNTNTHIEIQAFDLDQTGEYLVEKKALKELSETMIRKIHEVSEGLPLYLWYISERLQEFEGDISDFLESLPTLPEGNIRDYYEMLWQEFESQGKGEAQHLCGILACLRFPVHEDELFSFQMQLSRPDFIDAYKVVQHLLRRVDNHVEIFHNSFREFVLSKLDQGHVKQINSEIFHHLKDQEGSNLWFSHVFEYAFLSQECDYVLENVNRPFVDQALKHFRPNEDIERAIIWATECAKHKSDLVSLSRLAALKTRTKERIEQHLDRTLLLEALLAMGRIEDAINYSFSHFDKSWLLDFSTTLSLLEKLPEFERIKEGEYLFDTIYSSFRGSELKGEKDIVNLARCYGSYSANIAGVLEWCLKISINPDSLYVALPYEPAYSPHLEAFIDSVVEYQPHEQWQGLKNVQDGATKQQIHYFIIRALARHGMIELLKNELEGYIFEYAPGSNPELSFYGSIAGIQPDKVKAMQGVFNPPPAEPPSNLSHRDSIFVNFKMRIIALAYEGDAEAIENMKLAFKKGGSFWASYLYYLVLSGNCIGKHRSNEKMDWFDEANEALDVLQRIEKRLSGERYLDYINNCRAELSDSLCILTKTILARYPERIETWFGKIRALQDSKLWTTHYGFNEYSENYSFELNIYEKLSAISECRKYLMVILRDCAEKYRRLTHLKGETRSNHFLRLSTLASRCGHRNEAEEWLDYGIQATLIYGYHKDITLFQLIDIMEMLNKHRSEKALERCAEILELVDWMPALTDGRETKHLPKTIFEQVAKIDREAALKLLRQYSKSKAEWQSQECLDVLFGAVDDGDPEVLWLLTSWFKNSSTERGEYRSQTVKAKNKILVINEQSGQTELLDDFIRRLDHYIRTNISPRLWPNLVSKYWSLPPDYKSPTASQTAEPNAPSLNKDEFNLNGKQVKREEIESLLSESVASYIETMKRLQSENDHFYEPAISEKGLYHVIKSESSPEELVKLKDYLITSNRFSIGETLTELGQRFIELGDTENALGCFELAYLHSMDWTRWDKQKGLFSRITEHDRRRAIAVAINDAYQHISKYNGYDTPVSVAGALEVNGDVKSLEEVFTDYLTHVQELFNHIPLTDDYHWLKSFAKEGENFNSLVINLIVDELTTPEIDHGNRLLDSLVEFCIKRPELGLPIIFQRLNDAEGLSRHRLWILVYIISHKSPALLLSFADEISSIFGLKRFQMKLMGLKIYDALSRRGRISDKTRMIIQAVYGSYSKLIKHRTFRILSLIPSFEFKAFSRYLTINIRNKVKACSQIIGCKSDDLWAKIEIKLKENQNWNEKDKIIKFNAEWSNFSDSQGTHVIPFLSSADFEIQEVLNEIIDEVVEKSALSEDQIKALWRILQPCDPGYSYSTISPRPNDIEPLQVGDKDTWFEKIEKKDRNIERIKLEGEWITLFEKRELSQDEPYQEPYHKYILMHSCMIRRGLICSYNDLDKEGFFVLKMYAYHEKEAITLSQAKEITKVQIGEPQGDEPFLPILTWGDNEPFFKAFSDITSLAGYLVRHYDLEFRGFDLYREGDLVVQYEVWNEGYVDNNFSRQPLSSGTRLRIKRDFLKKILDEYGMDLCQSFFEKRQFYKKYHGDKPEEERSAQYYCITDVSSS